MKAILTIFLLFYISAAYAEVYEVIDANGRKSYTDTAPVNKALKVKKLTIDEPNLSAAQPIDDGLLDEKSSGDVKESYFDRQERLQNEQQEVKDKANQERQQALQAVSDATQALEDAKQVRAGDFFNNKNGGMRYKEQYLERVEDAQKQVDQAKRHYQSLMHDKNDSQIETESVDEQLPR